MKTRVEPHGYLQHEVELVGQMEGIKVGSRGLCTADLDDIFAVVFPKYGWITFQGLNERDKFKIVK